MEIHLNWKINLYVEKLLLADQQKQTATFMHCAEQQILNTRNINAAWGLSSEAAM